jgi:hypothetical protein
MANKAELLQRHNDSDQALVNAAQAEANRLIQNGCENPADINAWWAEHPPIDPNFDVQLVTWDDPGKPFTLEVNDRSYGLLFNREHLVLFFSKGFLRAGYYWKPDEESSENDRFAVMTSRKREKDSTPDVTVSHQR